MTAFLDNSSNQLQSSGVGLKEIFFQCILERSSKSLTHLETYFNRYYDTLRKLIPVKDTET